jgi:hypothetical protein
MLRTLIETEKRITKRQMFSSLRNQSYSHFVLQLNEIFKNIEHQSQNKSVVFNGSLYVFSCFGTWCWLFLKENIKMSSIIPQKRTESVFKNFDLLNVLFVSIVLTFMCLA